MQNCYNAPREQQAGQNERLTNKHIKTLSFLQEIVEENKQLKAKVTEYEVLCAECGDLHDIAKNAKLRITEIQQQYLNRADEINAMLIEKHKLELMKTVEDNIEAEKQWLDEKRTLLERLEQEKKLQSQQQEAVDAHACKEHGEHIKILQLKVDALQQEIDRLKEKNDLLGQSTKNQLAEIRRLQYVDDQGRNLTEEINALQQHNKELEFNIARLNKSAGQNSSKEQEEVLDTVHAKLTKLLNEKAAWETRESEYLQNMDALRAENLQLKRALTDSERMRTEMHQQLDEVLVELLKLKKQLASRDKEKEHFKEYIQIKRELLILQEENELLRAKTKKGSGKKQKNGQLPSLASGGNTTYTRLDSAGKEKIKQPPSYATLFNGKS